MSKRTRNTSRLVACLLPVLIATSVLLNPDTLLESNPRSRSVALGDEAVIRFPPELTSPRPDEVVPTRVRPSFTHWMDVTIGESARRNVQRRLHPGPTVQPERPIELDRLRPLSAAQLPPDLARPAPAHREPAPPASPPAPRTRTLRMTVTAYCPCPKCCGKWSDGQTASGKSIYANGSRFVAADTRLLPFGTRIVVPGYAGGEAVPVLDRGGRIKGRRLDLFFLSHREAKEWGTRELEITVYLD